MAWGGFGYTLAAGVELKPAYSHVHGLHSDTAMAAELQAYDRSLLKHVNQSLFAWRNLLDYGFHLVNKPVYLSWLSTSVSECWSPSWPDGFHLEAAT